MTLEECTKAELIQIINGLTIRLFDKDDFYLSSCLSDIAWSREQKRFDEAERYSEYAKRKRQEFIEIMQSHHGRMVDMPAKAIKKAILCLEEAEKADMKYYDMMKE